VEAHLLIGVHRPSHQEHEGKSEYKHDLEGEDSEPERYAQELQPKASGLAPNPAQLEVDNPFTVPTHTTLLS